MPQLAAGNNASKKAEPYLQHDTISKWDVMTLFCGDVPNFSVVGYWHRETRRGAALEVGVGGLCFDTCLRRHSQLKNVHGGTSRCGGRISPSKRIGDTLF